VLIVGAILVVVTVDPDGKIRVAGVRRTFDLTSTDFALARFNADGSSDSTFGAAGKVVSRFGPVNGTSIFAERFQPDGKIVAAGIAFANFAPFGSNGHFALARYNADGGVDTAFGSGGRLTTDFNGSEDEAQLSLSAAAHGRRRSADTAAPPPARQAHRGVHAQQGHTVDARQVQAMPRQAGSRSDMGAAARS
jgi:uncharacterized delta-60 repeat protein